MKGIFTLVFSLSFFFSFGQISASPPNSNFSTATMRPCHFDSTQMLLQADDWLIYQTLNDAWDGEVDSTRCIGVTEDTLDQLIIELDQIDVAKPVFVRSLMGDSTKVLLTPDWVYEGNGRIDISENTFINFSPNCPNGLCTGMVIGIEIPDSTGTSTNLRTYFDAAETGGDRFYLTCMTTEYFEENYLKEFIFKFKLLGTQGENRWFRPRFSKIYPVDSSVLRLLNKDTTVSENMFSSFDSTYNLNLTDIAMPGSWWENVFLLTYQDTTYPSPNHISYLELTPEENDSIPRMINLSTNYSTLHLQPFTGFRGGLVVGSDSIRHQVNLFNDGMFCLNGGFIDLTFNGGNNYIHQGGEVNFGAATSCMRFQEKSALIVDEEVTFEYGRNGHGMLALATGGTIELRKNSTLVIDTRVFLYELEKLYGVVENQQIYMELNKGSRLIFGKNAKLDNRYSVDKNMKLNIYMNGGALDISQLSSESRAVINLIYPKPPRYFEENVKVYPNPTSGNLTFSMVLDEAEMVKIEAYDLAGRLVFSKKQNGEKGNNEIQMQLELSAGVYFFKIKSRLGEAIKKIVVN